MNKSQHAQRMTGCYIPIPTLFRDSDLELNLPGMQKHIQFLVERGAREGQAVILVGGGAGEFHTLSVAERLQIAEAAVEAAAGKVGIVLGVQTTSQRDLVAMAKGAEKAGCIGVQASAPFYEIPTEDDVIEWLKSISDNSGVGITFYATPWTGFHTSLKFVERLIDAPHVVAIKWYSPDRSVFERAMRDYSRKIMFIDNSLQYLFAHMLGARAINLHASNYWPEWGQKFWNMLEAKQYAEAQQEMTKVVMPYYDLCIDIAKYTGGEGHIDKICMEYAGLEGGRCRPPTRDIREKFGDKVRQMAAACGVPQIKR
ncbi:MAG: dihydrodipicolinate synthase family protein [Planctomycetaceae bacterium]|nr:dihydrodipicolinate synthase family protein [Planctomycetaceae bacterium]